MSGEVVGNFTLTNLAPVKSWERTNALRFVERDWTDGQVGCRVTILQQGWICRETGETEWKDVEKVKE